MSAQERQEIPMCVNCGRDWQDEDDHFCLSCRMYVEPPLDNDELVRIRVLLNQPRLSALKMLFLGARFTDRAIHEAAGDRDRWTDFKDWLQGLRARL